MKLFKIENKKSRNKKNSLFFWEKIKKKSIKIKKIKFKLPKGNKLKFTAPSSLFFSKSAYLWLLKLSLQHGRQPNASSAVTALFSAATGFCFSLLCLIIQRFALQRALRATEAFSSHSYWMLLELFCFFPFSSLFVSLSSFHLQLCATLRCICRKGSGLIPLFLLFLSLQWLLCSCFSRTLNVSLNFSENTWGFNLAKEDDRCGVGNRGKKVVVYLIVDTL